MATAGGTTVLDACDVDCPCCGEPITLVVDPSAGAQTYIEDCSVCCRPITVRVEVDDAGGAGVRVGTESET